MTNDEPYIYQLFANKQELFAAAVDLVSELMKSTLAAPVPEPAIATQTPSEALRAARLAYGALIKDRDVMMFLMHASCSDDELVRRWFGEGMLDNVVTALHLADVDEPWARAMSGQPAQS